MRNHSYENDFDLHENETACRTHFHMKGFALRLVLKQRHERTRKWPVNCEKKWPGKRLGREDFTRPCFLAVYLRSCSTE